MEDLHQRPLAPADAPALTALRNAIEVHAGGIAHLDSGTYLARMAGDAEANTRMFFDPAGRLVAAALTVPPPVGGRRISLYGGVHPEWRGRGLGRDLFAAQLARAAELAAAGDGDGGSFRVEAGVMLADEDAQRLFRRFGLSPIRYWFRMVAPTGGAGGVAPPDGIRVTAYAPEHEAALYATHVESFTDHWGYEAREREGWAANTVRSERFVPELSRLAFDGEALVGYVLSYRDSDPRELHIGQVGVRRPWRRRGLAGAMLVEVLAVAGRAGLVRASGGVDAQSQTGAVGVYERIGFAADLRAVTYARDLTTTVRS